MLSQRLRHRITIQQQVETKLPSGEVIGHTWEPFLEDVPAEVLTGPGREFNAANAKQAEATARINMRWFPGLLPTMRILWDGRVFDILGEPETDATARKEWRLHCKGGVNDGS